MALAVAWLTDSLGLSMALGAFLGGMMLGETEFWHQLETEIRPFRDVLLGIFLVTMSMFLDVRALAVVWPRVMLLTLGGFAIKAGLVAGITRLAGEDNAVALRTGIVVAI